MAVRMVQNYGKWSKGDVISPESALAERLIGQGKAVPCKVPPSAFAMAEPVEAPAEPEAVEEAAPRVRGKVSRESAAANKVEGNTP